eukprot:2631124-Pyramimonas_sp.AAC.1
MRLAHSAEYLGFFLRPESEGATRRKAFAEYLLRAPLWGKVGCGFQLTLIAARAHMAPVLGFVAQLLPPPETRRATERQAVA